jgi:hypothetical protein
MLLLYETTGCGKNRMRTERREIFANVLSIVVDPRRPLRSSEEFVPLYDLTPAFCGISKVCFAGKKIIKATALSVRTKYFVLFCCCCCSNRLGFCCAALVVSKKRDIFIGAAGSRKTTKGEKHG